jgi:hypothetical protein
VKLLPAGKVVFQGALALRAAFEAAVFLPVAFAAGRTPLQGLEAEIDGELPGGAFLYVAAQMKNLLV